MKILHCGKDGGPESKVTGFWLCEIKSLFSIALLRFDDGSRESYHSHAFNSISWVLKGKLMERFLRGVRLFHTPRLRPIITRRFHFHRVVSMGTTWVFTLRGPWRKTWMEFSPKDNSYTTLTHGRKVVGA